MENEKIDQSTIKEETNVAHQTEIDNEEELEVKVEEISNAKMMSPSKMIIRRFFRSKLSIVGLIMIIFLFVFSFLGPYILMALDKIDFLDIITIWGEREADNYTNTEIKEDVIKFVIDGKEYITYHVYELKSKLNDLAGISKYHWLGTDKNGFDIFTRLMYGGRISLSIGFIVVFNYCFYFFITNIRHNIYLFPFGSKASRKPSPIKLNPKIASTIHIPAGNHSNG